MKIAIREIREREITFKDDWDRYQKLDDVTSDYVSGKIILDANDHIGTDIFVKDYKNLKIVYQEGDRTLLNRGTNFQPWVVVTDFNPATQSWWYGEYFNDFYEAVEYMKERNGR